MFYVPDYPDNHILSLHRMPGGKSENGRSRRGVEPVNGETTNNAQPTALQD